MPDFDDILLRLSIMLRLLRLYGAILLSLRAAKNRRKMHAQMKSCPYFFELFWPF